MEGVHVQPAVLQGACVNGLATCTKQQKNQATTGRNSKQQVCQQTETQANPGRVGIIACQRFGAQLYVAIQSHRLHSPSSDLAMTTAGNNKG